MSLFAVIQKNIYRILRSKTSAFVTILGPFILILLLGFAYNNLSTTGITVGAVADESQVSKGLLETLETRGFKVFEYETEESCAEGVKNSVNHICLYFYQRDGRDIIRYYVDNSNVNLVFVLVDSLTKSTREHSARMSAEIINSMIMSMNSTAYELEAGRHELESMMNNLSSLEERFDFLHTGLENSTPITEITDTQLRLNTYILALEKSKQQFDQDTDRLSYVLDEQEASLEYYMQTVARKKSEIIVLRDALNMTLDECWPDEACQIAHESYERLDESVRELEEIEKNLADTQRSLRQIKTEYAHFKDSTHTMYNSSLEKLHEQSSILSAFAAEAELKINQTKLVVGENFASIKELFGDGESRYSKINDSLENIHRSLGMFSEFTADEILSPVRLEFKPVAARQKTLYYLFPSFLTILMAFVGILLASTIEIKERTSRAYARNQVAPINKFVFVIGTYLTCLLIVLSQILIISTIAYLFFEINLFSKPEIFLLITVSVVLFSSIGIIIGNLLKNEETATVTSVLVSIVLLVFSNTMIPVENMSAAAGALARLSPFFLLESLLRRLLLLGASLHSVSGIMVLLGIELIILFSLVGFSFWKARKSESF
jgi:ABC-type multidrug transport system permease subunit